MKEINIESILTFLRKAEQLKNMTYPSHISTLRKESYPPIHAVISEVRSMLGEETEKHTDE